MRVPRAWDGAPEDAAAAGLEVPWPEAAVVDEPSLDAQLATTSRVLPARPLVLGGCAHAHAGAVRELARRHGRIGLVWLDPRDEPPPLRLLVGAGDVRRGDVVREAASAARVPEPLYVAIHGGVDRPEELELLLSDLPRPAGAGFSGAPGREPEQVRRLAAALGL